MDCSQDESKSDSKSRRALQGISGVHRQTFNIFKQTNEFSEVSKSKKVSKSRPLIEVCGYVCLWWWICVGRCVLYSGTSYRGMTRPK